MEEIENVINEEDP